MSGCSGPPPPCGNGVREGAESCDGLDLGGQTCETLGYALTGPLTCTALCGFNVSGCVGQAFPATGQTTCWDSSGTVIACAGTGHDGDLRAGQSLDFTDNGDGTITDMNTHLMWEKKSDDDSIHDRDNTYTWDNAFAVFIATLNSTSFAGHDDWRLPNKKELESIVDAEVFLPAVDPVFNTTCAPTCTVLTCSCTASSSYWSSTTFALGTDGAWDVDFIYGFVGTSLKSYGSYVRAVRGGL